MATLSYVGSVSEEQSGNSARRNIYGMSEARRRFRMAPSQFDAFTSALDEDSEHPTKPGLFLHSWDEVEEGPWTGIVLNYRGLPDGIQPPRVKSVGTQLSSISVTSSEGTSVTASYYARTVQVTYSTDTEPPPAGNYSGDLPLIAPGTLFNHVPANFPGQVRLNFEYAYDAKLENLEYSDVANGRFFEATETFSFRAEPI